jgi:opacity protein-like surface antigen
VKPFATKPFRESDLIAYHLHELSPRRARALEAAMQSNPFLAAESDAYATILRSFKGGTALEVDEEMMDPNWARILAGFPSTPIRPPLFSRWLVPTAAGLAFAATVFFVTMHRATNSPRLQAPAAQPAVASSSGDGTYRLSPLENSSPQHATRSEANPGKGASQAQAYRDPFTMSRAASLLARLHHATLNTIPIVPENEESGPMLEYIPLAHVPVPSPPAFSASVIDVNPVTLQSAPGPGTAPKQKQQRNPVRRERYMEVTLAMGGTLIGTRNVSSSNGETRTQGATHAVSAIGSFHQQLRPAVGYRFTASYTRPDFQYTDGPSNNSSGAQTDIVGRVYEFAGTYVVQGPCRGIVSTTVEGGTALMAFLPLPDSSGTTGGANLRAAGILGVGAEIGLTKHLAITTSYRVQVFKGPDFRSSNANLPRIATTLISNEPSVGVSYRFARK